MWLVVFGLEPFLLFRNISCFQMASLIH